MKLLKRVRFSDETKPGSPEHKTNQDALPTKKVACSSALKTAVLPDSQVDVFEWSESEHVEQIRKKQALQKQLKSRKHPVVQTKKKAIKTEEEPELKRKKFETQTVEYQTSKQYGNYSSFSKNEVKRTLENFECKAGQYQTKDSNKYCIGDDYPSSKTTLSLEKPAVAILTKAIHGELSKRDSKTLKLKSSTRANVYSKERNKQHLSSESELIFLDTIQESPPLPSVSETLTSLESSSTNNAIEVISLENENSLENTTISSCNENLQVSSVLSGIVEIEEVFSRPAPACNTNISQRIDISGFAKACPDETATSNMLEATKTIVTQQKNVGLENQKKTASSELVSAVDNPPFQANERDEKHFCEPDKSTNHAIGDKRDNVDINKKSKIETSVVGSCEENAKRTTICLSIVDTENVVEDRVDVTNTSNSQTFIAETHVQQGGNVDRFNKFTNIQKVSADSTDGSIIMPSDELHLRNEECTITLPRSCQSIAKKDIASEIPGTCALTNLEVPCTTASDENPTETVSVANSTGNSFTTTKPLIDTLRIEGR